MQVLETCMNHCGEKFHSEVAKFRFLNELIKVLSPKVSAMVLALLAAPGPAFKLVPLPVYRGKPVPGQTLQPVSGL